MMLTKEVDNTRINQSNSKHFDLYRARVVYLTYKSHSHKTI